mmetsp:Transcript_15764/g.33922  ORF Transcript_15764/g.33922 Transcript_15764/m.33922 type:complete len:424 (-) Transcript_15764:94-1365(-)
MDTWSKRKATEKCGGLGMVKHVDSNETRRLNRLKHVKSSIGSNMGHSGWQKQQIEKRRKEQLRQRKKAAKKKPLGDGIQVDTKISRSDAISKCGLKLKAQHDAASGKARARNVEVSERQKKEVPRRANPSGLRLNHRRNAPMKQVDRSNVSENLATIKQDTAQEPKQRSQIHGSNPRFRGDDGKENSDNSTNREPIVSKDTKQTVVSKKAPHANKYFMDIDSLRREHADAIKMLEELDKCEGNKRKSLDSEDNSVDLPYDYDSGGSYDGTSMRNQSPAYRMTKRLDDEFVRDCSDTRKECGAMVKEGDHAIAESFLNMSHLSISPRGEFDNAQGDYFEEGGGNGGVSPRVPPKNRSFTFDNYNDQSDYFEGDDEKSKVADPTPTKNRSFTASCASIEDRDFFGDADCDSCSSDDEDGYSSGTF